MTKKGSVDTGIKVDPYVTPEDMARIGENFYALVREPGWADFIRLIERRKQNLGNASLDDSPKMHKYWRGRRDELDELLQEIMGMAEDKAAEEDVAPEVARAFLGREIPSEDDDG